MAIQWSNWASLGKPRGTELDRPFAQRNQDEGPMDSPWLMAQYHTKQSNPEENYSEHQGG